MSPVHLKARKGEVASNAVLAGGDPPGRIRLLSSYSPIPGRLIQIGDSSW